MRDFEVIVAATESGGIGWRKTLPWKIPRDMDFFRTTTLDTENRGEINAIVMGRVTYESIPEKFRSLPGRLNIVITSRAVDAFGSEHVTVFKNLEEALVYLANRSDVARVFVAGGAALYEEALSSKYCTCAHVTRVARADGSPIDVDTFIHFPENGFLADYPRVEICGEYILFFEKLQRLTYKMN